MVPVPEDDPDLVETDDLARLIHEVLEETAWQADAQTIISRVQRLRVGLPVEDEFSVLLSWLGKCRLIHKLDQQQSPPESQGSYQVPDLLAVFEHEGRTLPVLVEVKSASKKKLSWKPDYYERLQNYDQVLGLPVLVAWKRGQIWSLFELRHLKIAQTNYNISFETAQKQNLLGVLAGDFVIILHGGVGLHITARKEKRVSAEQLTDGYRERWQTRIDDAYFENRDGDRLKKIGPGLWSIFLTASVEETSEITDSSISISAKVPHENFAQWAHGVFRNLLELRGEDENVVHWRRVLQKYAVPTESAALRKGAQEGIDIKVVRYVLDQRPQEFPIFMLSAPEEETGDDTVSHTLRGEPMEYNDPFEGVAVDDWKNVD